ncbi:protein YgfX [Undibacterium sp. KW1]|uniref:protein YgfX n=1 Tax=Undibacterium sp. KW1 TaxID=2058624 RepID=UPI00138A0AEC|nr:protein YgfX [Undibacterium sp. KW1]
MTIALHIITRASRTLLTACICMLALVHLSIWLLLSYKAMSFVFICMIVASSFCSNCYLVFKYWQRVQQSRQLSISATGDIVLHLLLEKEVHKDLRRRKAGPLTGLNVRLSHKTRIWPYFLSIFLLDEAGKEHKLLILPDSLSPAAFQALRVSLIWISQHQAS